MKSQKFILILLLFFLSSCQTKQNHYSFTLLSNEPIDMTNYSINTKDTQNYKIQSEECAACVMQEQLNKMVTGKTFVNATVEEEMGNYIKIKGYDVSK